MYIESLLYVVFFRVWYAWMLWLHIHVCLQMCLWFWLYGWSKSILPYYLSKYDIDLTGRLPCWLRVGIKCHTLTFNPFMKPSYRFSLGSSPMCLKLIFKRAHGKPWVNYFFFHMEPYLGVTHHYPQCGLYHLMWPSYWALIKPFPNVS